MSGLFAAQGLRGSRSDPLFLRRQGLWVGGERPSGSRALREGGWGRKLRAAACITPTRRQRESHRTGGWVGWAGAAACANEVGDDEEDTSQEKPAGGTSLGVVPSWLSSTSSGSSSGHSSQRSTSLSLFCGNSGCKGGSIYSSGRLGSGSGMCGVGLPAL